MARQHTICLRKVKEQLRRGAGTVENHGGWSIFVEPDGDKLYVIDDATSSPVPFQELKLLDVRSNRSIKHPQMNN